MSRRWIAPNGWDEFQHYKGRNPPWIKLHRKMLDDYEFHCLPLACKALAPLLWLLASEDPEGRIDLDSDKLSFRLRMPAEGIMDAIKTLIERGFFKGSQDASTPIAMAKQETAPETETEAEIDITPSLRSGDPPEPESDDLSVPECLRRDVPAMVERWNAMADRADLPKVSRLTDERRRKARSRLGELGGMSGWDEALARVERSPFCRGENDRGWRADFDFLMSPSKLTRLMEGKYDGSNGAGTPQTTSGLSPTTERILGEDDEFQQTNGQASGDADCDSATGSARLQAAAKPDTS